MKPYVDAIPDYLDGVEAFIFDWDDTLVDTLSGKLAQNMALAREFGVDPTEEEVRQHYFSGQPLMTMLASLCQTDDYARLSAALQRRYHDSEFTKRSIEGAEDGLRIIRELGFRTALLTATSEEALAMDMQQPGFRRDLFDAIMHVPPGTSKADPDAFRQTLAWLGGLGIDPFNAAYVGDGLGDRQGSLGAGMRFIGIENDAISATRFHELGTLSLPSVRALAGLARIVPRSPRG